MPKNLNRRQFLGSAVLGGVALTAGGSGLSLAAAESNGVSGSSGGAPRVKNVIYMIADGWGHRFIDSTSFYNNNKRDVQVYNDFPVKLGMSTYAHTGSYDPEVAWASFDYFNQGATDSAAAATALASGTKTLNGRLNMDPDGNKLKTFINHAAELGKATGVLSSVQLCHATPAGFCAHNIARGNYEEISHEMIEESTLSLIMGAGHPWYDDNASRVDEPNYRMVGGRGVWERLMLGQAGTETGAPWTLVETRDEFLNLQSGGTPERLIGIPMVSDTLQFSRDGEADECAFARPYNKNVPTLAEMAKVALNHLGKREAGFALHIEGGAIDWAGHANASGRMIEECIDFDNTVQAVVNWIEANSSWNETLLIVTSDHETGYLTGPGSGDESAPMWRPIHNRGIDNMPGDEWHSGGHTNMLVPYFAKGAFADKLPMHAVGEDPVHGPYIDNVTTANLLFEWLA